MLQQKRIVLAVTGSIAAYKAAFLVRALVKEGCEVRVLMTESAKAFITPLTLATLSRNPVHSQIIDADQWNSHVELGIWADAMVIAPATANTISKCAHGQADNLVVATFLSARCPVFFAPAMDLDMWTHPSTRRPLNHLTQDGARIIPVGHGELASGLVGDGRMAEPEEIMDALDRYFDTEARFAGKKVLVTAGPTHEAIDPVRFIGNPSTGTMGIEIAAAFARQGAEVTLVLGPSYVAVPGGIKVERVTTAAQMFEAAQKVFAQMDISVFAAAVSDYTPAHTAPAKIKKEEGEMVLKLQRTPDIALQLGGQKRKGQITVGFALETDHAEKHAHEKLVKKHFDMVVLNSLEDAGAGFGPETNKVKLLYPDNTVHAFELKTKTAVAEDICTAVYQIMQ